MTSRGSWRKRRPDAAALNPPNPTLGRYETAFRVIGRYLDEQKPRDVFFFEQEGAFVVRMLMNSQAGPRHELAEFTADDVSSLVARGPGLRQPVVARTGTPQVETSR